jgi:peptide/nickel transport system permease protein
VQQAHLRRVSVFCLEAVFFAKFRLKLYYATASKGAITASVGIMLLGLVPLSPTNWGMMLNMATTQTGAIYVPEALAYVLSPVFFIVLFQFSLICFASGLEEILDPRLA